MGTSSMGKHDELLFCCLQQPYTSTVSTKEKGECTISFETLLLHLLLESSVVTPKACYRFSLF